MLTEDFSHNKDDAGVLVLAVRRDSDTPSVDTDGNYSAFLVDSVGRLKVKNVKDSQVIGGTITIESGSSLSSIGGDLNDGIIDLTDKTLVGIQTPAVWTSADITFTGSMDEGITFNDLYDDLDVERSVVISSGRSVTLDPIKFMGITHLKIRSGTGAIPVNQTDDRVLNYTTIAL